jgi:hypothetical protein
MRQKNNAPKTMRQKQCAKNNAPRMKTRQSKLIRVNELYNPQSRTRNAALYFQLVDSGE